MTATQEHATPPSASAPPAPATDARAGAPADPPAPKAPLSMRVWAALPGPLRRGTRAAIIYKRLIGNYWYDMRRYARSSSTIVKDYPRENYRALITMDYHRLEKGMALPEVRPRFGAAVLKRLQRDLPAYIDRFGHDDVTDIAFNALGEYVEFHKGLNEPFPEIEAFVARHRRPECAPGVGGTRPLTLDEVRAATDFDVDRFFMARHSVRQYTDEPVDPGLVQRAVRLAMQTPSVCNRQSWRVHTFFERERIDKMLSFQDGNRGFGHTAPALLIITADMRAFTKAGERNQCWVDGGMFAGALVLALHGLRLGSCCLNWSVEKDRDRAMRHAADIPEREAVMMMLAIGHVPDALRVAQSPRRPVTDVIVPDRPSA